ncbi:MAG: hypothetical protein V1707_03135 [bacterium]
MNKIIFWFVVVLIVAFLAPIKKHLLYSWNIGGIENIDRAEYNTKLKARWSDQATTNKMQDEKDRIIGYRKNDPAKSKNDMSQYVIQQLTAKKRSELILKYGENKIEQADALRVIEFNSDSVSVKVQLLSNGKILGTIQMSFFDVEASLPSKWRTSTDDYFDPLNTLREIGETIYNIPKMQEHEWYIRNFGSRFLAGKLWRSWVDSNKVYELTWWGRAEMVNNNNGEVIAFDVKNFVIGTDPNNLTPPQSITHDYEKSKIIFTPTKGGPIMFCGLYPDHAASVRLRETRCLTYNKL